MKRIKTTDGIIRPAQSSGRSAQSPQNKPIDPEAELISDIEASLAELDGPIDDSSAKVKRRRTKGNGRRVKVRKPISKKKLAKRIAIAILLIILGVGIYFGAKLFLAGKKVFKGNPLSMLMSNERLEEDSNGRTNILIFGTSGYSMSEDAWDGAMLTDSIMVASVDQDKDDVYLMSLPRDLYVKNNCSVLGKTSGKLNEVFYCAYAEDDKKDEKAGAQALMKKAGEILGLDVQYYVHADWSALTQLVDAVGGVDVTIESSDSRGIYDSSTGIRYKNGEVAHLDGEKALALARARNHNYGDYGLAGGNYAREQNQQKILKALQQKALSAGVLSNPVTVSNMVDSLGNNLITSFSASHVKTLVGIAGKITDSSNMHQLPFVNRGDDLPDLFESYSAGGSYLGEKPTAGLYDYSEIQKYVAQNLSSDPVKKEGATIDVLNGSGVAGLASRKAEELEDEYIIGEVSNAPQTIETAVTIYRLSDNKPNTAKALAKKFNVTLINGTLAGYATDADFIIVYGTAANDD